MSPRNPTYDELSVILREQLKPFVLTVYAEAGLVIPKTFDFKIEAPRIVATLRTQGFNAKFKTVKGGEIR